MISRLKQLVETYGYYHIWIGIIHVVSIISLVFIESVYLWYGILFYLLVKPLYEIILHEYISHEMIKPRNRLIDLLVLFVHYSTGQSVKGKRAYHVTHHVHYKNHDLDPTQMKIRAARSPWHYILNLQKPVSQRLLPIKNTLYETNPWVKILDPHAMKIGWAYRILMFLILPVEWFIALVVYFMWFNILIYNFHDIYFHGPLKGKDRSWFVPVWNSQAWHLRHHESPDDLYFGPGKWKYLNLCYYWYKIFFRPNPDVGGSQVATYTQLSSGKYTHGSP